MKQVMWIGLAGMIGAILRTSIGMWIGEVNGFPIATLLVNLVATGALCFLATGACHHVLKDEVFQQAMTVGFLGSFSTFSAFSIETILLVENGQVFTAIGYVLASSIGGLGIGLAGFRYGGKWAVK